MNTWAWILVALAGWIASSLPFGLLIARALSNRTSTNLSTRPNPLRRESGRRAARKRSAIVLLAACGLLLRASPASAGGGHYLFDGGDNYQREQVRAALDASSFNWNIVPATVTIHIRPGIDTRSWQGNIDLDADLLDAGRFAWASVQDEFAHQVDFYALTPNTRAVLEVALDTKAWCYENPALQAHSEQGCERFTSMIPWAYWQSPDNAYKPTSHHDESATMPPARFRSLLAQLLPRSSGPGLNSATPRSLNR